MSDHAIVADNDDGNISSSPGSLKRKKVIEMDGVNLLFESSSSSSSQEDNNHVVVSNDADRMIDLINFTGRLRVVRRTVNEHELPTIKARNHKQAETIDDDDCDDSNEQDSSSAPERHHHQEEQQRQHGMEKARPFRHESHHLHDSK
jgi:hypothetical protein